MARQKSSDAVATLQKQQTELAKKLKEAQAKARKESQENERRLNELAGAVVRKELAANPSGVFSLSLLGLLAKDLTRAADRALSDLPPLTKETKPETTRALAPSPVSHPAPAAVPASAAAPAGSPYSLAAMGGAKTGGAG